MQQDYALTVVDLNHRQLSKILKFKQLFQNFITIAEGEV